MKKGFTLIELLIVVLIIAILAAIAVPNFLEFQTRAKVSRVKSDQRSLATAIEAYYVDNNEYPSMAKNTNGAMSVIPTAGAGAMNECTFRLRANSNLATLTTPISYITSYFSDAFATSRGTTFGYRQFSFTWILISWGPDRDEATGGDHRNLISTPDITTSPPIVDNNFETAFEIGLAQPNSDYLAGVGYKGTSLIYDPTNGTTSEGDVVRIKQ